MNRLAGVQHNSTISYILYVCFQVPFREAHSLSGEAVQAAETKGCLLNELTLNDLKQIR